MNQNAPAASSWIAPALTSQKLIMRNRTVTYTLPHRNRRRVRFIQNHASVARNIRDIAVVVANLKRRYSGVTSTVAALLPAHAEQLGIAAVGPQLPRHWPTVNWWSLIAGGWTKPHGRPWRIWHARRNIEMLVGWLLRAGLRQPWKLVFTSAAQRHHSAWTRFLLRKMDAVIATSPESGSFLQVPYIVNMHGINTERYQPAVDRSMRWAETQLPGKYGIGIFGRVRAQKGVDRFVDLMIELLPRHPEFTAVIVGAVTANQREFAATLQAKVKRSGLEQRIVFLGELPAEDVPLWLRRMTLVVAPQRQEGFGLVPAEAMASGVPVVATRVGAAMHLIRDGETGYLCDADDVAAIRQRVDELMSDPARAHAMGLVGRDHVRENFSIHREARGIEKVYHRLWNAGG